MPNVPASKNSGLFSVDNVTEPGNLRNARYFGHTATCKSPSACGLKLMPRVAISAARSSRRGIPSGSSNAMYRLHERGKAKRFLGQCPLYFRSALGRNSTEVSRGVAATNRVRRQRTFPTASKIGLCDRGKPSSGHLQENLPLLVRAGGASPIQAFAREFSIFLRR